MRKGISGERATEVRALLPLFPPGNNFSRRCGRSLVQLHAQNRVSDEIRLGCSGLYSVTPPSSAGDTNLEVFTSQIVSHLSLHPESPIPDGWVDILAQSLSCTWAPWATSCTQSSGTPLPPHKSQGRGKKGPLVLRCCWLWLWALLQRERGRGGHCNQQEERFTGE